MLFLPQVKAEVKKNISKLVSKQVVLLFYLFIKTYEHLNKPTISVKRATSGHFHSLSLLFKPRIQEIP
jgi:hypothetical protein